LARVGRPRAESSDQGYPLSRRLPGWLRFNALDAKTPWTDVVSVANYVVQYVFLFEATYGVQVYGLGVWGNKRTGIATTTAEQIKYVLYLRTTLDEQGLQRILIIASDQGDWATAAAMSDSTSPLFTPGLADAVGVVGNSGVDLVGTFVSQTGKPAWSTRMAVTDTTSTGAMNAVLDVLSGFVLSRGALSGWIADIGSSSTPYGFPQWHGGLLLAAQPLSGYVYPTPALWALAHITQFVPVGTRLLPVGSGSGTLQNGGFFVSWMDEVSKAWYLVIAKFGYPGSGAGSNVQRETATFTLGGSFANPVISVLPAYFSTFGYYSDQNCSEFNKLAGGITVSGSTFSVDLVSTGLYTITSQQDLNVHKGCQARDCPDRPPPPAPFGAHDIALCDSGNGAIVGDPGRLLVDVTGSFQCTDKLPVAPLVLAQVADGFPIGIGPDRDSRPHSLTGDLNMVDVDVSVSFAITSTFVTGTALYSTALLGARVSPFNVTASGTDPVVAMDTAPGVWLLATTDGQFLSWKLVLGLSPSLYAQPVAQGVTKAPFLLDRWATLRLIVRGRLAAGTFYQDPNTPSSSTAHNANANATRPDDSLLFMLDVAVLGAPSSGFLGIGSGEYFAGGVAFSDLNVRNTTGTCDGVPLENAQIAMEECQVGAPGLTFSFQRVDPNDANVGYNVFVGYDAEDEDTPGRTPLPGNTIDAYKAACTAMPECVAFNGNGWPKARLDDISPTGLTDLYVKQLPSGHLVLSANASLCATRDDGPATPILKLAACDATGTNVDQLFTIELTTTDGQWLTGPIASVRDNKVWDVYYSGESVDTQINVYGCVRAARVPGTRLALPQGLTPRPPFPRSYTHGANQYFVLDNGLIRVIQLGQCAGACSWL